MHDSFLAIQARSGASASMLIWAAVMVLASLTAFVFLCVTLYGWLSLQLGEVIASLVVAGIFIVIAVSSLIISALIRRRVRQRANCRTCGAGECTVIFARSKNPWYRPPGRSGARLATHRTDCLAWLHGSAMDARTTRGPPQGGAKITGVQMDNCHSNSVKRLNSPETRSLSSLNA